MKEFNFNLHESLRTKNLSKLKRLMDSQKFKSSGVDEGIYVNLITFEWDNNTIVRFAKIASDDQLATLIGTAILYKRCIPFKEVFGYLKNVPATIQRHHLKGLFLIASNSLDKNTLEAMIYYGCFDPSDSRPIVTIFRQFIEMTEVKEEVVQLILQSHPGHTEPAEYLRDECIPSCKSEDVKAILLKRIINYLTECKGSAHAN
ncbi:unnamed protein product [Phytomonas sp. Hart1]|nr:unnamed protein product [Phytomonas sp. Hart1]|eukprot:CCW70217.1 unnamed protein product [Phytomonas sp. isolate Hart1]